METEDIRFSYTLLRNQTMSSEEKGQFKFEGINYSNEEIKVTKCSTSCGCTVAIYKKVIEPGETFYVILTIDKIGQKGNFNQSATFNYSNGQEIKLKVNGTIEQPNDEMV